MLNIFLERKPLPNYRLSKPPSGELEKIIVKEDVGESLSLRLLKSKPFYSLWNVDNESQTSCVWRDSTKCHL